MVIIKRSSGSGGADAPYITVSQVGTSLQVENRAGSIIASGELATDTDAVLSAAFAAAYGGTLYIREGEYIITSTLELIRTADDDPRNTTIIGDGPCHADQSGRGTKIVMGAALADGMIKVFGTVDGSYPQRNITIKDLSLDGDERSYAGIGINSYYGSRIYITNVEIFDINGPAIVCDKIDICRISSCTVSGCGDTSETLASVICKCTLGGEHANFFIVDDCNLETGEYAWVHVTNTVMWSLKNSYLEAVASGTVVNGVLAGSDGWIKDNLFVGATTGHNIVADGVNFLSISGNEFHTTGVAADSSTGAILIDDGCSGVFVVGNRMYAQRGSGISFGVDGAVGAGGLSDIHVHQNYISGSSVANCPYGVRYASGYCAHLVVTSNVFRSCGIGINATENVIVIGNKFLSCTSGVSVAAGHYYGVIGLNDFTDTTTAVNGTGVEPPLVAYNRTLMTNLKGTAVVANGNTFVDVTHGCSVTPNGSGWNPSIMIVPTLLSNSSKYWVTNVGAVTFRINVDANPGAGTATFAWVIG